MFPNRTRRGKVNGVKGFIAPSSSSSGSSSDSGDSSSSVSGQSEYENFKPESIVKVNQNKKVPTHIVRYVEKYATKGIDKKTRQEMTSNWLTPSSDKLKGLETDRFFRKNYFKGKKWNGKLEKTKINTQLRILDVMGPLSVLWSEASRIKEEGQGMDPGDVIQLTQRAIVLAGNAHYVYNSDRRKSFFG